MKSWLMVALVLAVGIVDISAHIEAKRNYCRTHACQQGEQMAKLYADESAVIGAPFGMKYAEEYTVKVVAAGFAILAGVLFASAVSVTEFGAKGDGVTDDTAAIQRAIDFIIAVC